MRSASTATCRMISGEAALPATGRCTPTLIAVISRPCRRSCFADLISRNNSRPGGAGPDPSGGVTDVLGGAAGNRPGRVAREGVAAPCRAVADQPSGQRYAVRRLRIQRLTLPNVCVVVGGAASRYAAARSPRRVEKIGKLLNTVNQPGARTRPRRVRIHRNEPNPRG
jgi:hypothetical protein